MFAQLCGGSVVRLHFEHSDGNSCRRRHVDAVGLRLLCTYAGSGTEWQDLTGTVRRMPVGHVGAFKHTAWLDAAPCVLHRSPTVEHLSVA